MWDYVCCQTLDVRFQVDLYQKQKCVTYRCLVLYRNGKLRVNMIQWDGLELALPDQMSSYKMPFTEAHQTAGIYKLLSRLGTLSSYTKSHMIKFESLDVPNKPLKAISGLGKTKDIIIDSRTLFR